MIFTLVGAFTHYDLHNIRCVGALLLSQYSFAFSPSVLASGGREDSSYFGAMAPKKKRPLGISSDTLGIRIVAYDGKHSRSWDASRKGSYEHAEKWLEQRGLVPDGTALPSSTAAASTDAIAPAGSAVPASAPPESASEPTCVVAPSENAEADSPEGPQEEEVDWGENPAGTPAEPWGEDHEPHSGARKKPDWWCNAVVPLESAEQLLSHDALTSVDDEVWQEFELIGFDGVDIKPLCAGDQSDALAVDANQLGEAPDTPVVVNEDDELSLAILNRARVIRQLGKYWGFAEWLAWGWLSMTNVFMHFGNSVVDIFALFCEVGQGHHNPD